MIADTIIVVLVCIMPVQHPKEVRQNRFADAFEQADKDFDRKYKLDIEALKRAAHEAAISADEKTKAERDKIMKPVLDVEKLFKKYDYEKQ